MTTTQVLTPIWQSSRRRLLPILPILLLASVILILVPSPTRAQKPTLLKDINTASPLNASSNPGKPVRAGAFLFFPAHKILPDGSDIGTELFKTLGVGATTFLVKDVWPGALSSKPMNLTAVGNTLFFQASSNFRTGLWKSDGSTSGTVLVKDSIQIWSPVAFKNKLYFLSQGVLWSSDGTTTGTVVVKDFKASFFLVGRIIELVVMGNNLYMTGWGNQTGLELWKSDGTTKGTVIVKDVVAGVGGIGPGVLTPVGNTLYFAANDRISGTELWKSDGTAQGTVMVKDVQPGRGGAFFSMVNRRILPIVLTAAGKYLYFMADDGVVGAELWRTDGTAQGTILLKDIFPGALNGQRNSSVPEIMVAFGSGNSILFTANDGKNGYELWKSDGTPKGTVMVKDLFVGLSQFRLPNHGSPREYLAVGNTVYFAGSDQNGEELWRSDGTASGTVLVKDIRKGKFGSRPTGLAVNLAGKVVFRADDGVHGGELWTTDGTTRGTFLLEDIRRPPGGATDPSDAKNLTTGHGVTWFTAHDGNFKGLWQTDGTSKGTRLVSSVNVGGRSRPRLAVVDNRLFFNADSVGRGTELWVSDGTTSGTQLVKDIASGPTGESFPEELTPVGGLLYFSAYESRNGRELWRSDGTFAGTVLVKDIFPGKDRPGVAGLPNYSFPKNMVGLGNTLIFQATDGTAGAELWKSDGTTAGTVLVKDIRPGVGGGSKPLGSAPAHLTVFGNEVWFAATDMNLPALWKTDGTTKGTVKMKDIRVTELAVAGTTLFVLTDRELWKASGFGASSVTRVKNISKAQLHNPLAYALTRVGDDVYFIADPTLNATRGTIWKSDGTTAGTAPILDSQNNFVLPLSLGLPGERILVAAGSRKLYFSGSLTASGNREVWVTDGTKAGTGMVHDLWPGPKGSRPSYLTHAHGKLLFVANNGVVGNELWSVEVGGNAQALGPGCQGQGPRPILSASDPVLGGKMTIRYVRGGTSSASVLAIGLPVSGPALAFGACILPVDFTRLHVLQFLQTDAAGTWRLPNLPVPNNTSLKNLYLVLQAAQGPSPTLPFGLDLSNAVYLQPGN